MKYLLKIYSVLGTNLGDKDTYPASKAQVETQAIIIYGICYK